MVVESLGRDNLRHIRNHQFFCRIDPVRRVICPSPGVCPRRTRQSVPADLLGNAESQAKPPSVSLPRIVGMIDGHELHGLGRQDAGPIKDAP